MKANFGEKVISEQGLETRVGKGGGRRVGKPLGQRAVETEECGVKALVTSG